MPLELMCGAVALGIPDELSHGSMLPPPTRNCAAISRPLASRYTLAACGRECCMQQRVLHAKSAAH
jgi:hypothetical protein